MTRSDLIATIASRFSNLMAKEGEIAVPVFERPVPYFPVGQDLRERVDASVKHTPFQPAALDVAE